MKNLFLFALALLFSTQLCFSNNDSEPEKTGMIDDARTLLFECKKVNPDVEKVIDLLYKYVHRNDLTKIEGPSQLFNHYLYYETNLYWHLGLKRIEDMYHQEKDSDIKVLMSDLATLKKSLKNPTDIDVINKYEILLDRKSKLESFLSKQNEILKPIPEIKKRIALNFSNEDSIGIKVIALLNIGNHHKMVQSLDSIIKKHPKEINSNNFLSLKTDSIKSLIKPFNDSSEIQTSFLPQYNTQKKLVVSIAIQYYAKNQNYQQPASLTSNFAKLDNGYSTMPEQEVEFSASTTKEGISFSGLPTQSELIDALSIYIASRFKEEIALTLISEIGVRMEKSELIKLLFPTTTQLFNSLEPDNIPQLGNVWYKSISSDVIQLPRHLLEYPGLELDTNKKLVLETVFYTAELISRGQNMYDVLSELTLALKQKHPNHELTKMALTFQHYTELILGNGKDVSESCNTLLSLNSDELKVLLYLFHSYHRYEARNFHPVLFNLSKIENTAYGLINISRKINELSTIPKKDKEEFDFDHFITASKDLLILLVEEYENIRTLSNTKGSEPEILGAKSISEKLITIINETFDLYKNVKEKEYTDAILNVIRLVDITIAPEFSEKTIEYITTASKTQYKILVKLKESIIDKAGPILKGNFNEEYTKLISSIDVVIIKLKDISEMTSLTSELMTQGKIIYTELKNMRSLTNSIINKIKSDATIEKLKNEIDVFISETEVAISLNDQEVARFKSSALKPLAFFADAIKAENSKALSKVIDAYASKNSSYKSKRYGIHSIDINAFPGFYGGGEWSLDSTKQSAWVTGFSCPVGISFSWGLSRKSTVSFKKRNPVSTKYHFARTGSEGEVKGYRYYNGTSFSVQLNILDLGATVSYRFMNDSTEALPKEVSFAQVLSPGLILSYGFPRTPLSFVLGAQVTPKLRNFDHEGDLDPAFRVFGGLYFDIPIFNGYQKQRDKYRVK